jgi:hypothetical protein
MVVCDAFILLSTLIDEEVERMVQICGSAFKGGKCGQSILVCVRLTLEQTNSLASSLAAT